LNDSQFFISSQSPTTITTIIRA